MSDKQRSSNIELLRIIAIIMIVFSHLAGHGVMAVTTGHAYVRWAEGSLLNRLFTAFFIGGGDTAVGAFFIITGFFMIEAVNQRKLTPLISQVVFYGILSTVVLVVLRFMGIDNTNITDVAMELFVPVSGNVWWFISSYVLLCASSSYINTTAKQWSKKKYLMYLAVLWILWMSIGKVLDAPYYAVGRAVWFYLVGGYIRLYWKKSNKLLYIFGFALSWLLYAAATFGLATIIGSNSSSIMIANALKFGRTVFFGPAAAIFLFLMFKDIKMGSNSKINSLASCVLGCYLLHESYGGRLLFWKVIFNVDNAYNYMWFPLFGFGVVISVLLICFIVEKGRIKLFEMFNKQSGKKK